MRIPRVYIDLPLSENTLHSLPEDTFHYLCKVLRLKSEHPLIVFDGTGGQYNAILKKVEKRQAEIIINNFIALDNESPLKVTLGQTLSRGERMDYAIQKAVETGVFAIQPLFSERCEVKLNDSRIEKRVQHWQQVAISAAEQSGRGIIPQIHHPITLKEWVENCKEMLKLTLHHHTEHKLTQLSQPSNNTVAALIGPEGGLTEEEVKFSEDRGFTAISLGPRVLRTETAPIVILSTLNTLWGDII
ncbi:16S rRNA (uracil(1498)-N(3))-methyltransferase [Marinomonas sp. 15G1-11]|uniref:Ribosomal RNA small subunit methyltransferase E n=1 Tax=Marinomonas phaeophyticola TaxID=3004091 RepID=A0ABT4JWV5_9GAMM|nr:16S rRNA (uracil(1498)-N(3))-methyltransferase [Marinomonas sp. 15G1-11]MCZ2722054.1 16S rRNA (uracil(1498)-N(3))-methyltransferase [Marinomonas sp. 15G1-11]